MNYYFLRYVRWSAHKSKEEVLEFVATADTAADAKVFCDVATSHENARTRIAGEWRHERMEMISEDVFRQAGDWEPMGNGTVKRRWQ